MQRTKEEKERILKDFVARNRNHEKFRMINSLATEICLISNEEVISVKDYAKQYHLSYNTALRHYKTLENGFGLIIRDNGVFLFNWKYPRRFDVKAFLEEK